MEQVIESASPKFNLKPPTVEKDPFAESYSSVGSISSGSWANFDDDHNGATFNTANVIKVKNITVPHLPTPPTKRRHNTIIHQTVENVNVESGNVDTLMGLESPPAVVTGPPLPIHNTTNNSGIKINFNFS